MLTAGCSHTSPVEASNRVRTIELAERSLFSAPIERITSVASGMLRVRRHRRLIEGIGARERVSSRPFSPLDATGLWVGSQIAHHGLDPDLALQTKAGNGPVIAALVAVHEAGDLRYVIASCRNLIAETALASSPAKLAGLDAEVAVVDDLAALASHVPAPLHLACREASRT